MENLTPHTESSSVGSKQNPYLIPGAVVLAGVLIALALFLKSDSPATPNTTPRSQEAILKELNIDQEKFAECNTGGEFMARIDKDLAEGAKAGAEGTPYSILIAPNGQKIPFSGAQPYANLKQALDTILALKSDSPALDLGLETNPAEMVTPVTAADHIRGSLDAPVKIIEYSDFQCPFCKNFHATMQQAMDEYGKEGKIAWVYRHYPLESIHPLARGLAHEAECAAKLGGGNDAFWKYADYIFEQGE